MHKTTKKIPPAWRHVLETRTTNLQRPRAEALQPAPYSQTLNSLRIGSHTRVMFQGFTGRLATLNAKDSIQWGTKIVGGVVPDRDFVHPQLGLPVLPTVRRAMDELKPHATGIYVPAAWAAAAIEEAVEAEVPLIVAVAEHIPLHDMLRIHDMLKTQAKSRLVGPNSPGIICTAAGHNCRIGFHPIDSFSPGCVGIAAKSGTLSYEAVASTTRAGLGQSLCIGVGGDILPGTDLVEALQVLVDDPATRAIVLIGEIGGDGEVRAADWIREYVKTTPEAERKPIAALVAGFTAPKGGLVMGHSGAFRLPGHPNARSKATALQAVGVKMVNHPARFGGVLREMLVAKGEIKDDESRGAAQKDSSRDAFVDAVTWQQQRRQYHTATQTSSFRRRPTLSSISRAVPSQQIRSLHLGYQASKKLLRTAGISGPTQDYLQFNEYPVRYLRLEVDRATRTPCIIYAMIRDPQAWINDFMFEKILLPPGVRDIRSLGVEEFDTICGTIITRLKLCQMNAIVETVPLMRCLLHDLDTIFHLKEAKYLSIELQPLFQGEEFFHRRDVLRQYVSNMSIDLDDATPRTTGRLAEYHSRYSHMQSDIDGLEAAAAAKADDKGLVYHRLDPADVQCNIGTIVNGAGLAMNTIDALADVGGRAANFLDTGGKATAETVRAAFEMVLRDPRVRVVFVNVFGGLTRGDMIARGIILAFKELQIEVPVVVRIRGTNEVEGRQIIAESGLPLFAFDDFFEAAEKAMELAKTAPSQYEVQRAKRAKSAAREAYEEVRAAFRKKIAIETVGSETATANTVEMRGTEEEEPAEHKADSRGEGEVAEPAASEAAEEIKEEKKAGESLGHVSGTSEVAGQALEQPAKAAEEVREEKKAE